ncbi:MAG: hypothetical protein DSM106950_29225 [Stigonema ocellatum SAG 48.90 = DSM 106950]|nr:hypothetical protein [Stigonema ocellatum SAG 48.90 = DSM 106950]
MLLIDGMKISRKDAKTQKNLGVFAPLREAKNNSYLNSATPKIFHESFSFGGQCPPYLKFFMNDLGLL